MPENFERKAVPKAEGNEKEVSLIEAGYGDSDVYKVNVEGTAEIRKVYQPERMVAHFRKHLEESKLQNAVGNFIKPYVPRLKTITAEELKKVYLGALLEKYRTDSYFVAQEVEEHPDLYTYPVADVPEIASIKFEVLPQGQQLQYLQRGALRYSVSQGQEAVEGMNLEQLTGVKEAEQRVAHSGEEGYPPAFSDKKFADTLLHKFTIDLMKSLISNKSFTRTPFPIFNRIHPANVIPVKDGEGSWIFEVTDLSTSLCLDYAAFIGSLAEKYDKDGTVYAPSWA